MTLSRIVLAAILTIASIFFMVGYSVGVISNNECTIIIDGGLSNSAVRGGLNDS